MGQHAAAQVGPKLLLDEAGNRLVSALGGPDSHPALRDAAAGYAPRCPERTLLHRIVREQLETFLAQAPPQELRLAAAV